MSLFELLIRIRKRPLLDDVLTLVSGTVSGRLILFAALPLITRLYTPADFAMLAVYLALVNTLAVVACFRFDIAIPLAETDDDAIHLLGLAIISATLLTLLVFLPALIAPMKTAEALGVPDLAPYLWLVPLGVAAIGFYSALQFWATRARRFSSIALTRIAQATVGVVTMLGAGWVNWAPLGLLLGNMLALGAGSTRLVLETVRKDRQALRSLTASGLRERAHQYRRYPIFSTPEALANVAGFQIPIILIAAQAGPDAGHLYLATTVMLVPMALLGQAVSQVYASRAPDEFKQGTLGVFTRLIMRRLALTGLGPIAIAALLAPWLFPVVFGPEWERAGLMAVWIAPWIAFQFITSPVSLALYVTGNQGLALALQFAGLIFRAGATVFALGFAPDYAVPAFAASGAFFYLLYAMLVIRISKKYQ